MEIFLSRPSPLGLLFLLLSSWVLQDMEDYLHLGETHLSRGGFVHNTSIVQAGNPILYDRNKSTSSTITSTSATMQQQINNLPVPASFHGESFAVKTEGSSSHHNNVVHQFRQYPFARESVQAQANCGGLPTDMDSIKAKIVAHPQYSSLLDAFMSCQKVGASPEVVKRLSEIRREIENRQRSTVVCRDHQADPELDQFMEAFNDMLLKYQEELTRPLQEAVDFMRRMEAQLNTLTNGAVHVFPSDEQCEGAGSSEEDQDGSGGEGEATEIDPRAEERELKHHLLKKYSGYLSSLKQELSKKKKKGKLPKDARQKLLHWWELHYKWPYPSESEKVALAESTGLDQKQINNWFINQRKRHWKPSEDMQFVVMDGLQSQNTAFYMDGHFKGDGPYRFCP